MLIASRTSFLVFVADVSTRVVTRLLRRQSQALDVVALEPSGGPGTPAPLSEQQLRGLLPVVVLVGFEDPALETTLRACGRHVLIVGGTRNPATLPDAAGACQPTMIEQIEALLGGRLDGEAGERDLAVAFEAGGLAGALRHLAGLDRAQLPAMLDPTVMVGSAGTSFVPRLGEAFQPPCRCEPAWHCADAAVHLETLRTVLGVDSAAWVERLCDGVRWNYLHTGRLPTAPAGTDEVPDEALDPDFVVAQASSRHAPTLADDLAFALAKERGRPPTKPLDVLAVLDDSEGASGLVFSGGGRHGQLIRDLVDGRIARDLTDRLHCRAVVAADRVRLDVTATGARPHAIDRLADWLLEQLLGALRPVAAWRMTGRVAFRLRDQGRFRTLRRRAIAVRLAQGEGAAEGRDGGYLHPYVRALLDPTCCDLRHASPDDEQLDRLLVGVEVPHQDLHFRAHRANRELPDGLPLTELRLHFGYLECLVLEWTVERDGLASTTEAVPLWQRILAAPAAADVLAGVVDLQNAVDRLLSPFVTEPGEPIGKRVRHQLLLGDEVLADQVVGGAFGEDEPGGWARRLLAEALRRLDPQLGEGRVPHLLADLAAFAIEGDAAGATKLNDDRVWMQTSVALLGGPPVHAVARDEFAALLGRMRMADAFANGFAYAPDFARAELQAGSYARFDDFGSHFLVADHVFAYVGFGAYALEPIHRRQMPSVYARLWLVALTYLAVVRAFHAGVTRSLEGWPPTPGQIALPEVYRELERRLLVFTNLLWFREVTSQIQGVELFRLMREQTRIESEFDLLTVELERLNDHVENVVERRAEARVRWLTYLGPPVGVVTALLAFHPSDHDAPALPVWAWLGAARPWLSEGGFALVLGSLVALLMVMRVDERPVRACWRLAGLTLLGLGTGYGLVAALPHPVEALVWG